MQPEIAASVSPEVEARVRASFASQGLMSHLGASITHISTGRVVVVLPNRPEVTQQLGYVHAGATTAIADSAGGYAGLTVFGLGDEVLTVELKVNLVAPARGEYLEAVGTVLKAGRTLTICRTEVYAVTGAGAGSPQQTLVAAGQQTLIRVPAASA